VHLAIRLGISLFYRNLSQDALLPGVIKQQLLSRSKGEITYYRGKAFFLKKKKKSQCAAEEREAFFSIISGNLISR